MAARNSRRSVSYTHLTQPPGIPRVCGCPHQPFGGPLQHEAFLHLIQNSKEVLQCYHVTGDYTFLIKVKMCIRDRYPANERGSTSARRAFDGSVKDW